MDRFVQTLASGWPNSECPKVFAEGLSDNPRQIKRTVNVFLMLWKLAERRKTKLQEAIKPIRLAKIVAIQAISPRLYDLLKVNPSQVRGLEEYYRSEFELPAKSRKAETESDKSKLELLPAIVPFVSIVGIRKVLMIHEKSVPDANFINLDPQEILLYFTLTKGVETPQSGRVRKAAEEIEDPSTLKDVGKWAITPDLHVMFNGKLINIDRLDPKEYQILRYFLEHPDQWVSREELGKAVWQEKWVSKYDWVLNQAILRLRKKIGSGRISTVRGIGYIFHSS